MPDLGIIFQYHNTDTITLQNASSVFHHTKFPYPIILIRRIDGGQAWYDSDLAMYYWYAQRKVECARWLYLEWDVFCNQWIDEFYKPVWDEDLAGSNVEYPHNSKWPWFSHAPKLPAEVRPFACGVWPFNGVFMSDKMLAILSKLFLKEKWNVISELRIATAAKLYGITPVKHPFSSSYNNWVPTDKITEGAKSSSGIWHPIKTRINDYPLLPAMECLGESYVWPPKVSS